jgi:hypothetical protein
MTTFQDLPPQSRRAVRQSEREENALDAATQTAAQDVPYSFDATSDESQRLPGDAPQSGRRAQHGHVGTPAEGQSAHSFADQPAPGETAEQAAYRVRDYSPEGRRSAGIREQSPSASPTASFAPPARPVELDYQTHAVAPDYRPPLVAPEASRAESSPIDDTLNHTLTRRELREMRAAAEAAAPPLQVPPSEAQLPEAIDTLLNSGPIEIPTLAPPPGQSQALAEAMAEFDMLTRSRRESEARARDAQVASLSTPIVAGVPAPQASAQQLPFDLASAPEAPVASVPRAPVTEPTYLPQLSAPQAPVQSVSPAPVAEPTYLPQLSAPEAPAASAPNPSLIAYPPIASVSSPPLASAPQPTEPQASAPQAPLVSSIEQPPVLAAPTFTSQPKPEQSTPMQSAPVQSVPVSSVPVSSVPVVTGPVDEQDPQRGRSPRASGHWRVQAALEDSDLPYENTLSRTVGANTSAITTSALVLPSVPVPDSILSSLTSTGEILVTGTIDLPRSLGSTGAHPNRIDNSDFEDDPLDSQVAAPDSAPVRAIRAISTNTGTRGVIESKRPSGNRGLTAIIIVASVLCIGLVGILVFAFASGKL